MNNTPERAKILSNILELYAKLPPDGKRAFNKDVEKIWKRQQRKRRKQATRK